MKRSVFLLSIVLTVAAAADVKFVRQMKMGAGAGGMNVPVTTYVKGDAERMEVAVPGMTTVTITRCDRKQIITVSDKCKNYFVAPMPGAAPAGGGPARRGGVVNVTGKFQDTGEKRQFFGHTASKVLATISMDAAPNACMPMKKMALQMELWTIPVPGQPSCREEPPGVQRQADCEDTYKVNYSGNGVSAAKGLAVLMKMGGGAQGQGIEMEVTQLQVGPLDAALFEPPAGYTQAQSQQELYMCGMRLPSGVKPRREQAEAGAPANVDVQAMMAQARQMAEQARRGQAAQAAEEESTAVCVNVSDSSGRLNKDTLADHLSGAVGQAEGWRPAAGAGNCQLTIYTDVKDARSSGGGLAGAIARRAGGEQKHAVRVDYRLMSKAGQEVSRGSVSAGSADTGSDNPSLDEVAAKAMEKAAERAAADAARWKKR